MVACFRYISNTGDGKKKTEKEKTEREGQKCTFGNFFYILYHILMYPMTG